MQEAIDRDRPAGRACRVPRGAALNVDSAAVAAPRGAPARAGRRPHAVLLRPAAFCYPVVGGALVFKDQNHMTETFAKSLGPYLSRALVID